MGTMVKNWLIRTRQKQILGPISREKLIELSGQQPPVLSEEDELCSGNGYWFFVKETDLFDRYVVNGEVQSFNPISEAKDVLNQDKSQNGKSNSEESALDSTLVLKMAPAKSSSEDLEDTGQDVPSLPKNGDLDYPDPSTSDNDHGQGDGQSDNKSELKKK